LLGDIDKQWGEPMSFLFKQPLGRWNCNLNLYNFQNSLRFLSCVFNENTENDILWYFFFGFFNYWPGHN
jgi:hypothetical protein